MIKKEAIKKIMSTVGVMSLALALLTGCGKKDGGNDDNSATPSDVATATDIDVDGVYISYDDIEIEYEELKMFCMLTLLDGQILYSDVVNGEQIYKDKVAAMIREVKALYCRAIEDNMEFDDGDEKTKNDLVEGFLGNVSEEYREKIGISDEIIEKVITEYCYAEKLKANTKNSIGKELNEKYLEEYKDYNFQNIYTMVFPKVKTDENGSMELDDQGNPVALDEAEMAEMYDKAAAAAEEVNGGADAKEVAESYGVDTYSSEQPGIEGKYATDINDAVAELEVGQCTEVFENDNCYYTITLLKDNDRDYMELYAYTAAEQNLEAEYEKRIKDWLDDIGEPQYTAAWDSFSIADFAKLLYEGGLMTDMSSN